MDESICEIEKIILQHGNRGMETIQDALKNGYCRRAADIIINNKGTVLIGTGFPAAGSFETDGPIGAIALYKVLELLGYNPIFVFASPIFNAFEDCYATYEFPILSWHESIPLVKKALDELNPSIIISIERAGITADNNYYTMRKKNITELVSKYDLFLSLCNCPTIAIGDGGNEIGMGNVYDELIKLPIIPSVTKCSELVIATVSNWGVYGIIAAMSLSLKKDLFGCFNITDIMEFLIANGSVDGINHRAEYTEDGFPLSAGVEIINQLKHYQT